MTSAPDLRAEVLTLFAEAQVLAPERPEPSAAGGLEAARRAWRARQTERGYCRSCRSVALPGRSYCARHQAIQVASARASQARRTPEERDARNARRRAAYVPRERPPAPPPPTPLEVRRRRLAKARASKGRKRARYLATRTSKGTTRCGECGERGHNRLTCEQGRTDG